MLGLLIAIPVLLTLAGALTSPPHVAGVPVGRLLYLEADQPSEHTTLLRGLNVLDAGGHRRELLHETEPQDVDAGSREWITQPAASPDGRQVAFVKQNITLQEEQQAIVNQVWVMPLDGPHPGPRLLLDLTKRKLKAIVGLAWTADNRSLVFLNDGFRYSLPVGGGSLRSEPLPSCPPLKTAAQVSATRYPAFAADGALAYLALGDAGLSLVVGSTVRSTGVAAYAVSPDGRELAVLPAHSARVIGLFDVSSNRPGRRIAARWGWSVFGGRRVTSLHWSPDGKYLAYTVSKPPLEDELFYIDLATNKTYQLPVRIGKAGWDWAR